jgi:hypothetical protein
MSKKLIAVAAAAALALTGLVAIPANSAGATLSLTVNNEIAGGGASSTDAFTIPVPSQDVLRSTTTANRSVVDVVVATIENNAAVTVLATGGVKLVTAAQLAATTTTTATGTATLSLSANDSGAVTFYAYNTSTTAGSITVSEVKAGATIGASTVWLKGVTYAGNAYKLTASVPATAGIGATVDYTATVVDMFGNAVTDATVKSETLGGDATGADTAMPYSSTDKVYEGDFTNRTTAGATAVLVSIAVSADSVKALGTKITSVFATVNAADLQATVTSLTAQVAALTADYNALAAKWNARVASKKAPKKAVTLK